MCDNPGCQCVVAGNGYRVARLLPSFNSLVSREKCLIEIPEKSKLYQFPVGFGILLGWRCCAAGPGGRAAETVSKVVRRSILLPLLREVEEGEEEAKLSFETVSATRPYRPGNVMIIAG
jgi:hypothetical protein